MRSKRPEMPNTMAGGGTHAIFGTGTSAPVRRPLYISNAVASTHPSSGPPSWGRSSAARVPYSRTTPTYLPCHATRLVSNPACYGRLRCPRDAAGRPARTGTAGVSVARVIDHGRKRAAKVRQMRRGKLLQLLPNVDCSADQRGQVPSEWHVSQGHGCTKPKAAQRAGAYARAPSR